jgi:hypothetical protein
MPGSDLVPPQGSTRRPATEPPTRGSRGLPDASGLRGARILLAGVGLIGAPTAQLLARSGVGLLRLVDRDAVEAANVATQGYRSWEVGQPKARVLGRRIQEDCPGIRVESYDADLEDLALGLIHDVDLGIGALDSRRARQALISELAWPRGIPVVDGGVGVADGFVGRVQVFRPGPESACFECPFSPADYRLLALEYPCQPGVRSAVPTTGAPPFLGAAVAGTLVAEAARLLSGQAPEGSYEVAFDLWASRTLRSRLRRAPGCRFDHLVVGGLLPLGRPFARATAGDLLEAVEGAYPGQAVHLECRRGLRIGPQPLRVIPLAALEPRRDRPLGELGLSPSDRLRVRSERGPDAFIVLDDPGSPEERSR